MYTALVSASVVTWAVGSVVWVADSTTDTLTNPISGFLPYLNLGVIVLLVIMAATKKGFIPKWVLDDQAAAHAETVTQMETSHARELATVQAALEAAERREEEYKQLNGDLQTYQRDQLQPALIETTRVVSAYVQVLAKRGGGLE